MNPVDGGGTSGFTDDDGDDDPVVENGRTTTTTTTTTTTLLRNPYAIAAATSRQRQNQQVLVRQLSLEQLLLDSSFHKSAAAQTTLEITGDHVNKNDPLQSNNNNNANDVPPPAAPALQALATTARNDKNATTTTAAAAALTGDATIEHNVPQWQRLPSRTCSFESAEILTVTEACRHAALYVDKSVRITGVVIADEQPISNHNTVTESSSSSFLQKQGYRSFMLADPLSSLLQTPSSAAAAARSSAVPSAAAAAATTGQIRASSSLSSSSRLSSSSSSSTPGLRKQQHPFKPRQNQNQPQGSSTNGTTLSSSHRLGRPFRVPVLRPMAATAADATLISHQTTKASMKKAPQPLPRVSTFATAANPHFGNNKRPASQISTTASAKTPPPTTTTITGRRDPKQSKATAAANQYNNKVCVWFHPDQVPIMQTLKMGDLAMVIGEIRQVSSLVMATTTSSATSRQEASSGSFQQQHVLVARICTNANGTSMRLHHQALLVRRRHLLLNTSSSIFLAMPRNYIHNPYTVQKPRNSSANGDDDDDAINEDTDGQPQRSPVLIQLRPGCGPPPYDTLIPSPR
jgi:hypothetical protein